jgi:hypothetical protein
MTDYADIVRHAALVERTRSLIRMVSAERLGEVATMVWRSGAFVDAGTYPHAVAVVHQFSRSSGRRLARHYPRPHSRRPNSESTQRTPEWVGHQTQLRLLDISRKSLDISRMRCCHALI